MMRRVFLIGLVFLLAGCEVDPTGQESGPRFTAFEIQGGTRVAVMNSSEPTPAPDRTTCADGNLPLLVSGRPDTSATWNDYYVMAPGQREILILMRVGADTGLANWITYLSGEGFEIVRPSGVTFSDVGGVPLAGIGWSLPFPRFFDLNFREMRLRLADGVAAEDARVEIFTVLSTGSGDDLPRARERFTLIGAC